ncbi:unnamed protein product [Rotaria sordida]|uniref:Uncharacterized protein n=1 Tax=Rotaria sordida TaxID=392033 RepID=A0A818M1I9_9BILA|nr:unnamed protein product [Rotaria sordida]
MFQSFKNLFTRNKTPSKLPPGAFPNGSTSERPLNTITKPSYQTDEEDDESIRNYNIPEQTRAKLLQRDTIPSKNTYGSESSFSPSIRNSSNTQLRASSTGFQSGFPINNNSNQNRNPLTNINTSPNSDLSSQASLSTGSRIVNNSVVNPMSTSTNKPSPLFGGFPPGMNSNQSVPPPPSNPSLMAGGFPPGMNINQSSTIPARNQSPSPFGGVPPGMNLNQSSTISARNQSPSPFGGVPPGMNLNQSSTISVRNQSPSPFGGAPPGINLNQAQPLTNNMQSPMNRLQSVLKTNPQSSQDGFPLDMNSKSLPSTQVPRMNNTNNPMNIQQESLIKHIPSFHNQSYDDDNVSRLELDYPIENVLIDANIPSAMAIKLNEIVEQDRLGKAYHINRYTFEPPLQRISLGNNQQIDRRLIDDNYHGGTRYIREIKNNDQNLCLNDIIHPRRSYRQYRRRSHSYSETPLDQYIDQLTQTPGSIVIQAGNFQNLEDILGQYLCNNQIISTQSSISPVLSPPPRSFPLNTNTITEPIFHYTACALPNDPMRYC